VKRFLLLCTLLIGGGVLPLSAIIDTNNNGLSNLWERKFDNGDLF